MHWKIIPLIYFIVFIFFTIVYLFSFHTRLFNSQTVLFYRGIYLLIVSFIFVLISLLIFYFKISKFGLESLIAALIVSASIHLSLFIIFPVTFDRSVTMHMLNRLESAYETQSCGGLSKDELRQNLINEYIVKRDATGRRIREQNIINMIEGGEDCVRLTGRGLNFVKFSRWVNKIYGIK